MADDQPELEEGEAPPLPEVWKHTETGPAAVSRLLKHVKDAPDDLRVLHPVTKRALASWLVSSGDEENVLKGLKRHGRDWVAVSDPKGTNVFFHTSLLSRC